MGGKFRYYAGKFRSCAGRLGVSWGSFGTIFFSIVLCMNWTRFCLLRYFFNPYAKLHNGEQSIKVCRATFLSCFDHVREQYIPALHSRNNFLVSWFLCFLYLQPDGLACNFHTVLFHCNPSSLFCVLHGAITESKYRRIAVS